MFELNFFYVIDVRQVAQDNLFLQVDILKFFMNT